MTVRDAETESLLRALAHPLFRVAGVDPALVRITLIQARPINAFVTTGNRLFINTGLIQQSAEVGDLAGVLAHETGHIAGGHVARLPEEMRNALFRSLAGMLLGGARGGGGRRRRRGGGGDARRPGDGDGRALRLFPRAGAGGGPGGHDLPGPARLVRRAGCNACCGGWRSRSC